MKTVKALLIAGMFLISPFATADWKIGVNGGSMSVKFDENTTSVNPINVGFSLGYTFSTRLKGLGLEFEATRSAAEGEIEELPADNNTLGVESQGVYLSYRTGDSLYVKGRIGFMKASLTGPLAEEEGGETFGIAAGYEWNALALEVGVTSIDDDVFYGSVGLVLTIR